MIAEPLFRRQRPTTKSVESHAASTEPCSDPPAEALESVIAGILADAEHNPLHYVLRSNTHHDGE